MSVSVLVTLVVALFASTGFWSFAVEVYRNKQAEKREKNKPTVDISEVNLIKSGMLGLLHDKIYSLGNQYIAAGSITIGQYDNFMSLAKPYEALGGNGTGKKLRLEVEKLPVVDGD